MSVAVNQVTMEPIREANARAVESALQLLQLDKLDNQQVEDEGYTFDLYTA